MTAHGSNPPLSTSVEDYLERIHELTEAKGYARVADIAAALGIRRRHRILDEFLTAIGVPPAQAEKDIEGLEHHISTVALEKIEALLPLLPKIRQKGAKAARLRGQPRFEPDSAETPRSTWSS